MKNIFKKLFPFLYKRENEINEKFNIINIVLSNIKKEIEKLKNITNDFEEIKKNYMIKNILKGKDLIKRMKKVGSKNIQEILSYNLKGYEPKLTSEQRIKLIKRNNPELLRDLIDNN